MSNYTLVQHANYDLEGVALRRGFQLLSLLGQPAYGELHSVQLSFR